MAARVKVINNKDTEGQEGIEEELLHGVLLLLPYQGVAHDLPVGFIGIEWNVPESAC